MQRRVRRAACLVPLGAALLGVAWAHPARAAGAGFSFTPSKTRPYAVCGRPTPGHSACLAILVPSASGSSLSSPSLAPALASPSFSGSGVGGGYAPADLRAAYGLPSASAGSGQTVAIVDAFNDPNAESDLAVYRARYGIAECTTANGCFKKVNQTGGTEYPSANAGWAVEISLDLDMVSAACPKCHLLLVEATNNLDSNLYAAENEAAALGATEVSNSWGGGEYPEETAADPAFNHPGVPITVSAGDSGYEVEYPAASPDVIAVGGTALRQASGSRGWSETAWAGTGSGCSVYEAKPAWQTDNGCTKRTNNDVAAVASPETPLSVADSYKLPREFSQPEPGWTLVGGTSASSPLIAGTMALANAHTRSFAGADALYLQAAQSGTGVLDDVLSGSNGSCGTYLCNAAAGYDGPTGLGSPFGAPFVATSPTVLTKPAGSITPTTATLNATVNPNGADVSTCKFEYGTASVSEKSVPCAALPGSGEIPVAVSAAVGALTANTVYRFRISATNAGGTSKGAEETFKTPAACTAEGFCTSLEKYESSEAKLAPSAVAVEASSGNFWVAEGSENRVVQFNPERKYVRQFGSTGTGNGQFNGVGAIATNAAGDVYAIDPGNQRVQEFGPEGKYITQWSVPGADAIALDGAGNVWLDQRGGLGSGPISEYSSAGSLIKQFGSSGSAPGQLGIAYGMAFSGGNLYVAELTRVQEFSTSGALVRVFDEPGSGAGQSNMPRAIAANPANGNLYVSEVGSNHVQIFSPAGAFISAFGSPGAGAGQFSDPQGIALSSAGTVYVADTGNGRISEWKAGEPPTFATALAEYKSSEAKLAPSAVAVEASSGNFWVAEGSENRVVQFNPERKYVRQFGSTGTGNGQFNGVGAIATNAAGDVYAIDPGNQRVQEFGPEGKYITQWSVPGADAIALDGAGNVWLDQRGGLGSGPISEYSSAGSLIKQFGSSGSAPGQLGIAYGMAFSGGNLYVAELTRVQEFSTSGALVRVFDEPGSGAGQSNMPRAIAANPANGNLYVSEVGSNHVQIFSPAGAFISAFGSPGAGAGQFSDPQGIAAGPAGRVYVADTGNARVQEWVPGS